MTYELILKEEADHDVLEGYVWYEQKQGGLGEKFLEEVEKYLSIIRKNPRLYTIKHTNYYIA